MAVVKMMTVSLDLEKITYIKTQSKVTKIEEMNSKTKFRIR